MGPTMRLPRMTTRRWMAMVAVVAVTLASSVLFRRHLGLASGAIITRGWRRSRRIGRGALEERALTVAATNPVLAARVRVHAGLAAEIRDQHARLKEKYRNAARYPWLPIAPDESDLGSATGGLR